MEKKPMPERPVELPDPERELEVDPYIDPEDPFQVPQEDPELMPEEDPFETPPIEVPVPGEGP